MDKNINRQNKRGFALLVTLSVLTVVIALTVVLLGYFDIVRKDASNTKALIQANIFYANVLKALGNERKALRNLKKIYQRSSRLSKGNFNLSVNCKPLSSGININWLYAIPKNKEDKTYQNKGRVAREAFQFLGSEYKMKDPEILYKMLVEAIGGKKKFVQTKYNRLRQKNGISSYKQFSDIVTRYQVEVDDNKVGAVPWKKYFSFTKESELIDVEYSSSELLHYLLDIDLNTIKEWQVNRKKVLDRDPRNLKQLAKDEFQLERYTLHQKNGIISEKLLPEALCKVGYNVGGHTYHFTFEYINGGGRHFEFFRQH